MREPVRHPITNIEAKSFTIQIILGIYSGFTKPWPLLLCYVERIITWSKLGIIFQLLSSDGRHTGLPERSCGRIYADMGTQWPAHTIFIFRSNFRDNRRQKTTHPRQLGRDLQPARQIFVHISFPTFCRRQRQPDQCQDQSVGLIMILTSNILQLKHSNIQTYFNAGYLIHYIHL